MVPDEITASYAADFVCLLGHDHVRSSLDETTTSVRTALDHVHLQFAHQHSERVDCR